MVSRLRDEAPPRIVTPSEAMFDERWAAETVAQLVAAGVAVARGLDDRDIDDIGAAFGVAVPEELALLLQVGVPSSPGWAAWSDGGRTLAHGTRRWIDERFAFDIAHNDFWHPLFGERPPDLARATGQAHAFLATAPPLLPIFGHRFLTTGPAPRAVLSVWQAIDSILYGNDLADYLTRDHRLARPAWATPAPPPVPVWEDLFDLFG